MYRYICIFAAVLFISQNVSAAELKLWPGTPPDEKQEISKELEDVGDGILRISNVSTPTLSFFPSTIGDAPAKGRICVVIFPGGAYNILAYSHEGTEIAQWLNSLGISAAICKYRVPRRAEKPKHQAPLQDAQRAIKLVRKNAQAWGVDANKIGVLGFSAGGHLSVMAATAFKEQTYQPIDDADALSCRPDFAMPIYPAYLISEDRKETNNTKLPLSSEIKVSEEAPPFFLTISDDDWVGSIGPVRLYMALKDQKVPCELHIFVKGGHGYGILAEKGRQAKWNELAAGWLRDFVGKH